MNERIVAIVGRPNVGKSALFNRLAGRKIAIVHDMPGVTRDRISAECRQGKEPFSILDTGGIGGNVDADFTQQVHAEVEIAMTAAHVIVFVVDGFDGVTPVDLELARKLRRSEKPVILAINKIDDPKHDLNALDFEQLGFPVKLPISAEHNRGTSWLIEAIEARLPAFSEELENSEEHPDLAVKIALVGRPNVGKSSLTNAILGDARTIVSPISGTTRDAVDIPYSRGSKNYLLIDTAGIRARTKVSESVEFFSVVRAEAGIRRADLVCLVLDAAMGVTSQDQKIAGMIQQWRRPCVIAVNKWDLVEEQTNSKEALNAFRADLASNLFGLSYAPLVFCSAKNGIEMARLFNTIEKVRKGAGVRLGTGPLNRLLQTAMMEQPPAPKRGRRFKLLYATHPEDRGNWAVPTPEFVLFCNSGKLLDDGYQRYLEAAIRREVPYVGLPLHFTFREREERGASRGTRKSGPAEGGSEQRARDEEPGAKRPPRRPVAGARKRR